MSHTKRYWIDDHSAIEDTDGKWVLHSDHAALVQQSIRDHGDWRSKLNFLEADYKAEIARLTSENEVLRKKVDWLMKADRLVIWNGIEWQVRHVVEQPIKPRE